MIVSDAAVKNRVSVVVLVLIVIFLGVSSYLTLPRENMPDISIPHVFVTTTYKGVSSEDVETSITIKIENKLKGLDRVKNIRSVSYEGLSQIDVEFLPGTDIDEVLPKVKDKVDQAKSELPSDLESDPMVTEVNFSDFPIITFSLAGPCGPQRLKTIADDLKDKIEAIPGVLEAVVSGGLDREIKIEVDPDKLAYFQIPITVLQQVVASENQNTSGGAITLGDGRYQLKVPGEFQTPEEILGLVVATHQGNPIYLKDVATVVDGYSDEKSRSRLNGEDSVNIAVKKRVGENIIEITDKINTLLDREQQTWPEGTTITKMMDQAKEIRLIVADLENNIITGFLLVIIVLFFAMGIRNAVLVGLSIPFSMMISFAVLQAMGITLNMVVLFSLILALGMLVDNAIVIVENIYRYMQQGVPRIEATMKATSEVAWPVIGSTLTTLAVFAPVLFWPGLMGEFMKYLPITLIVTLSSSLVVALVINPALCAFFLRVKAQVSNNGKTVEQITEAGEEPIQIKGFVLTTYTKMLRGAINHKIAIPLISFSILLILFEMWMIRVGVEKPIEFFPSIDPQSMYVNIDPPEGTDLSYVDRIVKQVEMAINGAPPTAPLSDYVASYALHEHQKADGDTFMGPTDLDNIQHIYSKSVQSGGGNMFESNSPNHLGIQFLDFEDRKASTYRDIETIRKRVQSIAGADITVAEAEHGPPTGPPINIEISGDNFSVLGNIAKEAREAISKIPYVYDVRDDYVAGLPTVRVRIDRQKAALFNLSTNAIGFALKTAYNGLKVSTFYEGDEDYDIVVTLSEENRRITDVLHRLMIPNTTGQMVPLTTLATIDYTGGVGNIVRVNHNRVVTVKANVDENKMPGPVVRAQAVKMLAEYELPPGYSAKFTGENEFQQESQDFLLRAFMIALFLVFLILVTLFNSITQPIIIMTSIILSLGGAFLGLYILRLPFSITMSGMGIISLAGIVVNNAIVLIDYTNKLRQRGMSFNDAIVSAGATRLRPVLLTAITTMLGLLPMVTGVSIDFHHFAISWSSESALYWRSMAVVVIFGLLISTILTLVVVPTLYALIEVVKVKTSVSYTRIKEWYWSPFGGTEKKVQ